MFIFQMQPTALLGCVFVIVVIIIIILIMINPVGPQLIIEANQNRIINHFIFKSRGQQSHGTHGSSFQILSAATEKACLPRFSFVLGI